MMIRTLQILLLVVLTIPKPSEPKAVLQVAFGVEENQLILKSLNSTISYLGDEADRKLYRRILLHYLEFLELNMRRNDSISYERLRHTQALLIPLYDRMLSKNLEFLRAELNRLGRDSRDREKTQTKLLLRLGFRDLAEAEQKLTFARNTRPQLYLLKLREMLFALKILKRAGRFVVYLGLLHDAEIYRPIEIMQFEQMDAEIMSAFIKDREKFRKMHWDNHFKVLDGSGIYFEVLNGPITNELAEPLPGIDPAYVRIKR
ncbi:hypothetical protein LPTSP4_14460 [Leptospira ryugenii]|uniref:Uncharacterized protein n=1 Tax=Leptospira ryugenii TaxID=1917863 RepID=A0A2P2DZA3_9LEPT|nr:hypothetical protein [Leptospira ryugenii]GBF49926.1 hypothetical protein LPTSP4_14460 [Leptospira ryugenii]